MFGFAVISLLATAPASAPAPAGDDVDWLLSEAPLESRVIPRRIEQMSARFLGTPYVHSPLGEGEGVDPDPPIRFDAVDCLTFVEETMALALAPTPSEVEPLLERVRYAERRSYEERNHLMEAQWLPHNVQKGFVRDVTREYGGKDTVVARKSITKAVWASPSSKALGLPESKQPVGNFDLEMIPLDKVRAHAKDIPSGTILLVVREDRPTKVTRITHLGFVIQKGERTYLRHAARDRYARVVDEDLETFLARNSKYAKWPVSGVALYEVRAPSPVR